jgi:8-amino-7-oxononanoate synthase
VLTALIQKGDIVFNDQVNHASIIDGCRTSEGTIRFYRHNDMENLEKKLKQYPREKPKLIITDGVFSMDGDIVDLPGVVALAKKYNATVMLDDAHALGVLGERGTGTAEYHGVKEGIDLTIATFSKALGGMGGAVCGSNTLIKFIHYHSRQFIFSTSMAPPVCASAIAALEVLETEPQLIQSLHRNRKFLSDGLKKLGYDVVETKTAIIPVLIRDEKKTYALTHLLDEMGVFVNAVTRPSVPRELSRLRVSVMATQTEDHLAQALVAFQKAGRQLRILND